VETEDPVEVGEEAVVEAGRETISAEDQAYLDPTR